MEFVTIKSFTDVVSGEHYAVGDRYPHRGFAKKERIAELSTNNNKRSVPLIKEKKVEKQGKPVEKRVEKPVEEPKEQEEEKKPKKVSKK